MCRSTMCDEPHYRQRSSSCERVDTAMIEKIKEEGLKRSKVMETISYITDVHGPRLTGSPLTRKAGEWAKGQLTEWGLENAQLETWGPFGRGWTLEACSANMVEPHFSQLIAYPKAWTPSTPKTVRGEPIYLEANTKEDLEKYRGKLGKAIVLISPPREVKALFEAPATRQTDSELLALRSTSPGAPTCDVIFLLAHPQNSLWSPSSSLVRGRWRARLRRPRSQENREPLSGWCTETRRGDIAWRRNR